jgi:hypothetical protein
LKPPEKINQKILMKWRLNGCFADKAWVICEHIRKQGLEILKLGQRLEWYKARNARLKKRLVELSYSPTKQEQERDEKQAAQTGRERKLKLGRLK